MLSFPVKIFTKDIIMLMILTVQGNMFTNICTRIFTKIFTKDIIIILTVQGKWGHCPPTCNIINEGSSSQPESAPATVILIENSVNDQMADV